MPFQKISTVRHPMIRHSFEGEGMRKYVQWLKNTQSNNQATNSKLLFVPRLPGSAHVELLSLLGDQLCPGSYHNMNA